MNTLKYLIAIALLLLVISCDKEETTPMPTTLAGKIDQYLDENQSTDLPGVSIAVRKNQELVYHESKGMARFDTDMSIDSETQFRLGSISKPITAIVIMQLIEQGKLSLGDSLLSFLPQLPASFADITIEHLLAHRSGLLDYIDDNTNVLSLNNLNMEDALNFISSPESGFENLEFGAGTSGRYSNTGYVLLALIIEEVTNTSLPDYMDREIFKRFDMGNSFVISEHEHLGDHGNNYALSNGTDINVLGFNSLIYGASGVVSTTDDMLLFIDALLNYELISKESLDMMTQTVGVVPNIQTDYGLGWMTGTGNYWHTGFITSTEDYWHSGGFDGYRTVLSISPELGYEAIILTNGGEATKDMMWDLLEIIRLHYKN